MVQPNILSKPEYDFFKEIENFEEEFGDQLEACHPEAFDLIYEILQNPDADIETIKIHLSEFHENYLEELEGCNEEAYDQFLQIFSMIN